MSIKVRVQDFQSISDATVIIDGFTVVTGPNNSGKTAFMRAIRGLFTNAAAGPLVRHGCAQLTVTIEFSDGNTVMWEKGWNKPAQKGGTVNRYTLNGVALENVGSSVPDEVAALGIHFINAGGQKMWPQMAEQFAGVLFLINSTGSVVAEAVADVEKVGKLSGALKLSESDRRGVSATLKTRRKDVLTLEGELAHFEGLEDMGTTLSVIEETSAQLQKDLRNILWHQAKLNVWTEGCHQVEQLAGILEVPLPKDPVGVQGTRGELNQVSALYTRHMRARAVVEALEDISTVSVPEDPEEAMETRNELHQVSALHGQYVKARAVVEALEGISSVGLPERTPFKSAVQVGELRAQLQKLANNHAATKAELASLTGASKATQDIHLGVETSKLSKYQGAISKLDDLRSRREKVLGGLTNLDDLRKAKVEDLRKAGEEVQGLLSELGVCPTCHQGTGDQHAHAH